MTREWPTADLLRHRAATTPERTAVLDADSGDSRTYREFDAEVGLLTERLADDLPERATVGLLMNTRLAFAGLFFATMRLSATLVPFNARLTPAELEPQVERVDVDVLVCEAETEDAAVRVAPGGCRIVSVDDPARDSVDQLDSLEPADWSTAGAADASVAPRPIARDHTQLILFTSGTTGRPKGVRLTVGNLLASATDSAFRLGVRPGDRWLSPLPMYHMGGLAPVVRSTLYGTTAVLQREFDAGATARAFEEHGITGVSLVPTMLRRLLDSGWSSSDDLRFVLLGGAPADADLVAECEARGVPVCPTYGMTETASQVATALPEQAFAHEGTVGQPLLSTDVAVVDGNGDRCEPGESGELVVAGPTVTPGYLDAETTEAAFGERGFHTGDVGYRDEDGRLWVLNRRSDRIVTGGENVDPGEVARALRGHPAVRDAAVVGLPDEEWGERVGALVVPEGDASLSADDLRAFCDCRLAGFKRPRTMAFADALPRTASGTVERETVRERLEREPRS